MLLNDEENPKLHNYKAEKEIELLNENKNDSKKEDNTLKVQSQEAVDKNKTTKSELQSIDNSATNVESKETDLQVAYAAFPYPHSSFPVKVICPNCGQLVVTVVRMNPSWMAHMAALLMFVLGLWCYSCIPYCIDGLQNIYHFCPNCGMIIAEYIR